MKYDGVVIRFNNLYLFVYDPDKMEIRDGIVITEHECYKEMKDDQLMVVEVIFRDGTQELDQIDLDEFIYGDSYGIHDTFLEIYDLGNFTNCIFDEAKLQECKKKSGVFTNLSSLCLDFHTTLIKIFNRVPV